jgi:ribulose-5-phosphate 4-epimerase/fuculose-1-phosphate aldolase
VVTSLTPTGNPQSDEYRYKKDIADLRYHYVLNPASPYADWALRDVIEPAFRALQDEFGVKVEPLAYGDVPACRPGGITYLLYGPTNPLAIGSGERAYLAALAAAGVRTNIISAYPLTAAGTDRPDYVRASTVVPDLCDALDINAIYPDDLNLAVGIRSNTAHDVYLNAIGETIRVKYEPTESRAAEDVTASRQLQQEHARDIAELARLHREHHLWQRKPHTDGSIMFTHDGHWFVSQTVTDKTRMTAADFDLVTSFDEGGQSITYAGPRLPSSDAPEFLMVSSLLSMHARRPRLIVHFHHRELTRGSRYRDLVTTDRIEGGRFASGRRFFHELRDKKTNWFIIREHGMVWTGDSVAEFADYVYRVVAR